MNYVSNCILKLLQPAQQPQVEYINNMVYFSDIVFIWNDFREGIKGSGREDHIIFIRLQKIWLQAHWSSGVRLLASLSTLLQK
jgi:hypothetical protein